MPTRLTEIYNITLKKYNRSAHKYGWIRPSIGEFFVTHKDFDSNRAFTYFGDGSDGNLETTGNVNFSSTIDGDTVYKNFDNLIINSGHTVTVENRCKGLVIYCEGDCVIDGTLSMTARGCIGAGEYFAPNGLNEVKTENGTIDLTIPPVGGINTANPRTSLNVSPPTYFDGNVSTNGACGGGGSGGASNGSVYSTSTGGAGGAGTTWCGGAGGGGCGVGNKSTYVATDGSSSGGAGGAGLGYDAIGAGGAGNPGGSGHRRVINGPHTYGWNGDTGAGGLLMLAVKGTLTINGSVQSNGSAGGIVTNYYTHCAAGGGSGGGSITILHNGDLVNNGTITVAGGTGGSVVSSGSYGGSGGLGSLRIHKVS